MALHSAGSMRGLAGRRAVQPLAHLAHPVVSTGTRSTSSSSASACPHAPMVSCSASRREASEQPGVVLDHRLSTEWGSQLRQAGAQLHQRVGSVCSAGLVAAALVLAPALSLDVAPAKAAAMSMAMQQQQQQQRADVPVPSQQEAALRAEEARFDENLMTSELRSFLELLDRKGSNVKADELEAPRAKLGFRRSADGRVSLRGQDGTWFNVKADMQAPGFLLLRSEQDGSMFFLPPDDAGQILQVDLSDDAVVAQLFSSGAWFDVMDPLKVAGRSGRPEPLKLSPTDFRITASLLDGAEEASE